ncbi:MAG: hypothetical protein JO170_20125 [Verrucomicrobia bacterium]|nr:hypothetical protein [Verrucomicrobiota bacterium]
MAALRTLFLKELHQGMYGLTPECGMACAQAADVCLELTDAPHPAGFAVLGEDSVRLDVIWNPPSEQAKRSWRDRIEATEQGATAIALLVSKSYLGEEVLERSYIGGGFDYWVGKTVDSADLFRDKKRLEISGLLEGDINELRRRSEKKIAQTRRSDELGYQAYVIVVGFRVRTLKIVLR